MKQCEDIHSRTMKIQMAWETWLTVSDGVAWVWRQEKRQIQDEMIPDPYSLLSWDQEIWFEVGLTNPCLQPCNIFMKYINTYTAIYNNDNDDIDEDWFGSKVPTLNLTPSWLQWNVHVIHQMIYFWDQHRPPSSDQIWKRATIWQSWLDNIFRRYLTQFWLFCSSKLFLLQVSKLSVLVC